MPVNLRGKQYATVAERVAAFRADRPDWSIVTSALEQGDERVTVYAEVRDPDGRVLASGHAEEYRGSSNVNRTSALENCETSAVGRALAFLGYAGDASLASADELRDKPPASTTAQAVIGLLTQRFGPASPDTMPQAEKFVRDATQGAYGLDDIDSSAPAILRALKEHQQ